MGTKSFESRDQILPADRLLVVMPPLGVVRGAAAPPAPPRDTKVLD